MEINLHVEITANKILKNYIKKIIDKEIKKTKNDHQ